MVDQRLNTPCQVQILHEQGIWTAICDPVGLVVEANSLDELQRLVPELCQELAQLNKLNMACHFSPCLAEKPP